MSYSTIMVQFDAEGANDARLQIAADLAERFDAKLIGIAAGDVQPMYFAEGVEAQEFLEKDRASLKAQLAAREELFRKMLKGRAKSIEWRSALGRPADFVAREARAADLIVTGSHREHIDPLRQVDPGELALRAGRPVLVVPPKIEWLKFTNILVAWKDAREARRAVCDALPLLHKAKEVVVVELAEREADRSAAKSRVEDVAAWLVRRGINAAAIAAKALIGVPAQIELIAQDEGADIIVAGAYGHTRLTEWVFGGVTRELLKRGKCCAMLSH